MATLKTFTAQGGTAPNSVTNADPNGPDAPTTVNIPATCVVRYASGHCPYGSLSVEISTGGTAGQATMVWTHTSQASATYRGYFETPASFAAQPTNFRVRSGSTQCIRGRWNTSGQLQVLDTTSSNPVTSTDAMATSTIYRYEIQIAPGATSSSGTGTVIFWPASADSGAGDAGKTITLASFNMGSTNAVSEFGVGQFASAANIPSWYSSWIVMASGTGTLIGPAALNLTMGAAGVGFTAPSESVAINLTESAASLAMAAAGEAPAFAIPVGPAGLSYVAGAPSPAFSVGMGAASLGAAALGQRPDLSVAVGPAGMGLAALSWQAGLAITVGPATMDVTALPEVATIPAPPTSLPGRITIGADGQNITIGASGRSTTIGASASTITIGAP